jgi:cytochrome c2
MAGEQLFSANGCTACHSTGEDTIIGPGLSGVYVRAGERTALDVDGYIEQSIREPDVFVVDGFIAGLMPSFDELSASEITDLIAYLKTLN